MAVKTQIILDTSAATPSELSSIFTLLGLLATPTAGSNAITGQPAVAQPEKAPLQEPAQAPTPAPSTPGKRTAAQPVATAQAEAATPAPGPATAEKTAVPASTEPASTPTAAAVAAPSPASTAATDASGFEEVKDDEVAGDVMDFETFKAQVLDVIKRVGNRQVRPVMVEYGAAALVNIPEGRRADFLVAIRKLPDQAA